MTPVSLRIIFPVRGDYRCCTPNSYVVFVLPAICCVNGTKRRLAVSAIARKTGFSYFHFIRLFRAVFGETPHQYRSRAQIEKAKHLLILTDYSVTQICLEVGFTSLGSFSSRFSQRVGMSPSAFQRRYRPAKGRPPRELPPSLIPGCLSLMGGIS